MYHNLSLLFLLLFLPQLPMYCCDDEKNADVERLIKIVENDKADLSVRTKAVDELAKKKAKQTTLRLGKVLQGRYDVLAFRILVAFEQFRDPRANPIIRKYQNDAKKKRIVLPGKINTAVEQALDASQPH